MKTIEIRPGATIAYADDWFGPPWETPRTVVLVHGNSESSRAWYAWVPRLGVRWRVIRPDLPGFGRSPAPPGYGWRVTELAADLARFLDALAIGRCHLAGAKYGGSACIALASERPERLASLALFGSPVRGSGSRNADLIRERGVRDWARATMRARLGSQASEAQCAWWADELMGQSDAHAAYSASAARIDMELEGGLARITVPALIVSSEESGLQSVAAVKQYAARLPDARVVILAGDSYHVAASAPEACIEHAMAFWGEVDAARAER